MIEIDLHPTLSPPPTQPAVVDSENAAPTDQFTVPPARRRKQEFWQWVWVKLNGEEGSSYVISLLVHLVVLALLAIPVSRSLMREESFTTLVQADNGEPVMFDGPIGGALAGQELDAGGELLETKLFDAVPSTLESLPMLNPALTSLGGKHAGAGGGDGEGGGGDGDGEGGGGGVRIREPKNAVRAGNFSVWSLPILQSKGLNGVESLGEPGAPPKVRESYYIVIRIRVPKGKRRGNLNDLSGMVVGTDGYRQRIPDDRTDGDQQPRIFFYNTRGQIVPARADRQVPIIDGTMEVLVRVPGADIPLVRDTIKIHSKMLDEEQALELVFQPRQ